MYTITLKGSTDEAGVVGVVTLTLDCWTADPDRLKEGEDLTADGGYITESLLERRVFDIEFLPFSTASGAHSPNHDDLEELQDLLRMPHKWITACTLPRWTNTDDFTRLYALLPVKFIVTNRGKSLNRDRACTDFKITVAKQTREA